MDDFASYLTSIKTTLLCWLKLDDAVPVEQDQSQTPTTVAPSEEEETPAPAPAPPFTLEEKSHEDTAPSSKEDEATPAEPGEPSELEGQLETSAPEPLPVEPTEHTSERDLLKASESEEELPPVSPPTPPPPLEQYEIVMVPPNTAQSEPEIVPTLVMESLPPTSPLFSYEEPLILNLIRHLPPSDLLRCRQVSRLWRQVASNLLRSLGLSHINSLPSPSHFRPPSTLFTVPTDLEVFLSDFRSPSISVKSTILTGIVSLQFDQCPWHRIPRWGGRRFHTWQQVTSKSPEDKLQWLGSTLSRFRARFEDLISTCVISPSVDHYPEDMMLLVLKFPFQLRSLKVLRVFHEDWDWLMIHKDDLRKSLGNRILRERGLRRLELQLLGKSPEYFLYFLQCLGLGASERVMKLVLADGGATGPGGGGWPLYERLGAPVIDWPVAFTGFQVKSLPQAMPQLRQAEVELHSLTKFRTSYFSRLQPFPSLVEFGVILTASREGVRGQAVRFSRASIEALFHCLDALFTRSFTNVRMLSLRVRDSGAGQVSPPSSTELIDWEDVGPFFMAPWNPETETRYRRVKELVVSMWLVSEGRSDSLAWLGRKCPRLEMMEVLDKARMEEWYRGQPGRKRVELCEQFWSWVRTQMPPTLERIKGI